MLAKFERELLEILPALPPWIVDRKVSIACGVSVAPFINRLCGILKEKYANLDIYIYPIHNHFFGESVTVTGLITGRDIAVQLDGQPLGDELLISRSMLRLTIKSPRPISTAPPLRWQYWVWTRTAYKTGSKQ